MGPLIRVLNYWWCLLWLFYTITHDASHCRRPGPAPLIVTFGDLFKLVHLGILFWYWLATEARAFGKRETRILLELFLVHFEFEIRVPCESLFYMFHHALRLLWSHLESPNFLKLAQRHKSESDWILNWHCSSSSSKWKQSVQEVRLELVHGVGRLNAVIERVLAAWDVQPHVFWTTGDVSSGYSIPLPMMHLTAGPLGLPPW